MDLRERVLYHQIHPLKLAVDILSAVLATIFFWQHRLTAGLLVGVVAPVVASALILSTSSLERERLSSLGCYVRRHLDNRLVDATRLVGVSLVWAGAWTHLALMMVTGLALVAACWMAGIVRDRR